MSPRHFGNGVTVILLLLCVLLSVWIYEQWQNYSKEPPVTVVAQNPASQTQSSDSLFMRHRSKSIQISQFSEILARPLFTEGRMPEEKPAPEQVQATTVGTPKLKLEGVVMSPESRVAVVRDLTDNSILRLAEGMIHAGWRLTKVDNSEVIFTRGDETFDLSLELSTKPNTSSSTSRFRLPNRNIPARPRPGEK